MDIRIETWGDHQIRFVEIDNEWWAVLKDICDALKLRSKDVSQRIPGECLTKTRIPVSEDGINGLRLRGENKSRSMTVINEMGIYEALFTSRKLEARKFRLWAGDIMRKLRQKVGLQGYEVMRMTDPDIQDEISHMIDTLYWDEEKKCVMRSVTVAGGDVEQVPFE